MAKIFSSKLLIPFFTLFTISCSVLARPPRVLPPFRVGFYQQSCPPAEYIVHKYVSKFVRLNPGLAAGLIRLHFHDCFVRGCDASVLLDGPNSEKESIPNKGSLRGLEVIDAAKAELELRCPGVVSCADILTFAARDSAWKVGNIYYDVPSGRRDGNVSLILEPLLNLPPPFFNASALRDNFARKGLSLDEMVTLSGAHSIGISHCSSFLTRLYPTVDPTLDPKYAAFLKRICPPPVNGTTVVNPTVNLDSFTPNALDNKYYVGLKVNKGLLTSDQTLFNSPLTKKIVLNNAQYGYAWATKFAAAMVKMGKIEVLTGSQGEIRKNCHAVN
ncbi:peroxidase 5-like [Dorcoceras hygrometricum]|uniref:Peroxidase n=1 Tax=Dorcoceras hygrometricum TaxID=472368 RepID=A0A2Z7ALI1_9LAMI|nr:peroxidase 5-like [Dorcoceras hygrometricum]